jgi:hypothetical protein
MALGCVKWVDDLWTICEKKTIPAHTEITYTFPGGTSAQEVLIRPQEVTKMLMNNFDMDPNWGKFAWDWVNAFKDTVQKGPKGLYSFKKPFQDLFDIKGKLDLSHLMSVHRASAPLYKNPVVTLDQFGAGKIIEKMKKMITESQAKKK